MTKDNYPRLTQEQLRNQPVTIWVVLVLPKLRITLLKQMVQQAATVPEMELQVTYSNENVWKWKGSLIEDEKNDSIYIKLLLW